MYLAVSLLALPSLSLINADDPNSGLKLLKSIRQLLPHPPMPPHKHHSSKGYHGCFGISDDEVLSTATDYFGDDVPPCAIYVNDTLVAGSGGTSSHSSSTGDSSSGSGGWWSGWFGGGESGGGESSGSSGGGSSGSGSDGSSSAGANYDGNDNGDVDNNDRAVNNDDAMNNNYYGNTNADDDNYGSPLVYFDLSDCQSYSNLWLWDLALSCDNSTSLVNCQCQSAEILFQYGTLKCPDGTSEAPYCPSNCPICNTCMQLMGCIDKTPIAKRIPVDIPVSLEKTINRALPIALGVTAAIVTLLAGVTAHKHRSQNRDHGKSADSLNSSLVGGQSESTVEIDIAGNAHIIDVA